MNKPHISDAMLAISFVTLVIAIFYPVIIKGIKRAGIIILDILQLNPDNWPEMDQDGNWINPEEFRKYEEADNNKTNNSKNGNSSKD